MVSAKYKIRNWKEYNKALVDRGRLTLWLEEGLEDRWYAVSSREKQRGRQPVYSEEAKMLCLTFYTLYDLTYRMTQGFVDSLLERFGWTVRCPNYTRLCRYFESMKIALPRRHKGGSIDIVLDSTGLKVYGEGEWKVREHGTSKRRTWRKFHIGADPLSHEIIATELTGNDRSDSQEMPGLIDQVQEEIERGFGDGAYDNFSCYKKAHEKGMTWIAPPKRNAVSSRGDDSSYLEPRNRTLERIDALTRRHQGDSEKARKQWKVESDYHTRSIAENAIFRFKTAFGDTLKTRTLERQKNETKLKASILNQFLQLPMPQSIPFYPDA